MTKATVKTKIKTNGSTPKFFYGWSHDMLTEKEFTDDIKYGNYNDGDIVQKYQLVGSFKVELDHKLVPTKTK